LLDDALLERDVGFLEGGLDIAGCKLDVIRKVAAKLFVEDGSALLDGFLDVGDRRQ